MQDRLKYIADTVTEYTDSVNWDFDSSNTATIMDSTADAGLVSDDKSTRLISKAYGTTILDSAFCQSEYEDSFPKMVAYLYSHYKLAKNNMTLAEYASFVSNKETPIDYEYGYQFYMLMMKIIESLGNTSKSISKFHSYKVIETEHFRISIKFTDSTGKLVNLDVDEDLDTNGNKVLVVYLDGDNISSFSTLEYKLTINDMAVQICDSISNKSGVDSPDSELREIANKITKACSLLNCKVSWKFNDMQIALHSRVLPLNDNLANVGLMYDEGVKLVSLDDITAPVLESCEDFVSIFSYLYSYYKTFNNENLTFDAFITWLTVDKTNNKFDFICQLQLLMLSVVKILKRTTNVTSYKFYESDCYYFEIIFKHDGHSKLLKVSLEDNNSELRVYLDSDEIDIIFISNSGKLTIYDMASLICNAPKLETITEVANIPNSGVDNTPVVIRNIANIIAKEPHVHVKWLKESDRKYVLSDKAAGVCIIFSEHNNEIYLVSTSDASVLVSSSYFGSINKTITFERMVSSLYLDYTQYKLSHDLDDSFSVKSFLQIQSGILKGNKFNSDTEFYCLMKSISDVLKNSDFVEVNSVNESLNFILTYSIDINFRDVSGKEYEFSLTQHRTHTKLTMSLNGKLLNDFTVKSVDDMTIDEIAETVCVNNIISAIECKETESVQKNQYLVDFVDSVKKLNSEVTCKYSSDKNICRLMSEDEEVFLGIDNRNSKDLVLNSGNFSISSYDLSGSDISLDKRLDTLAVFCADLFKNAVLRSIYLIANSVLSDLKLGNVTDESQTHMIIDNNLIIFTLFDSYKIVIDNDNLCSNGYFSLYDGDTEIRYCGVCDDRQITEARFTGDIEARKKFGDKVFQPSLDSSTKFVNLRLVALKYENTLIGFRFKADNLKGYDISVDVAKAHGITAMKVLKAITLENRNGLLLSKSEISSGNIIEDISDNDELITKLINKIKAEV